LATVVIGGLVSATFLTLFVLPTFYAFIYRKTPPPPDNNEGEMTRDEPSLQTAALE
jgi:cobalt-zinc-cadmium resistance protein CzcA